jgi:hypothetical protein
MTSELEIVTENLYITFSKYPFKSTIEGCPCCVSDSNKSTLHSKQLRELEDEDLSRYAFKAMTTWGDLNDYKHYLPRIFELTAKRKLIVDTFVTLGKLEYGNWKQWDKQEQESIFEFLNAWWKYDVNSSNYFDTEVLIELHKYLKDLKPMLKNWNVNIETQGFRNFVELVEYHYHEIAGKNTTFKSLSNAEMKIFKNWIMSNVEKLESGFFKFENDDKEFSESISNALYIIETMK